MVVLASIVPKLQLVLMDNERISTAAGSISANVIAPTIRAKAFPTNVNSTFLALLFHLTKLPQASKYWRRDVSDALNDARFFCTPSSLVCESWFPILAQLVVQDKDRLPELLTRLAAPTTAGVVFGVGATSARMEADRKTQLNLRRVALLLLSCPNDAFVVTVGAIEEKIVELFSATPVSAPSSSVWTDVFVLLRALVLKVSAVHLAALWPVVTTELQKAITSVLPYDTAQEEKYSNMAVLQACKLLDTLILTEPDDFQLYEWLFITDTIDSVYRPANWAPTALVDEVAEALGTSAGAPSTARPHQISVGPSSSDHTSNLRAPVFDALLDSLGDEAEESHQRDLTNMSKQELATRILQPFFGQLSLLSFEATYAYNEPDIGRVTASLLRDIFAPTVESET